MVLNSTCREFNYVLCYNNLVIRKRRMLITDGLLMAFERLGLKAFEF